MFHSHSYEVTTIISCALKLILLVDSDQVRKTVNTGTHYLLNNIKYGCDMYGRCNYASIIKWVNNVHVVHIHIHIVLAVLLS